MGENSIFQFCQFIGICPVINGQVVFCLWIFLNLRFCTDVINTALFFANNLKQAGSGFGCDTNQVKIIDRKGNISELPSLTKEEVADQVFDRIETLLQEAEL